MPPTVFSGTIFRLRPRVELMEDRTLLSTFLVSNTGYSGPGSLRQAILDSDSATGATNTIDFDIPGQGVQTIAPLAPLPSITNPVLIDGFSQPSYSGTPLIVLSGSQAGGGDGLLITAANVTVRGLDIDSFSQGAGIHLTGTGATGDWIYGDLLGTDPTGTQAEPNDYGVEIDGGAAQNLIGTNGDGVDDAAEWNVISGNTFYGVQIQSSDNNVVAGDRIGTDAEGAVALPNITGVVIDSSSGNTIGGTAAGAADVISGNTFWGVDIGGSSDNLVEGDLIGTDATGMKSLANAQSLRNDQSGVNPPSGVFISGASTGNTIGGTGAGAADVISGNYGSGIAIEGSSDNLVAGDFIGTDETGTIALGNTQSGVNISAETVGVPYTQYGFTFVTPGITNFLSSTNNTIGGTSAIAGNLIANNGGPGVAVTLYSSVGNPITGNRIFGNTGQAIDLGDDGVTENGTVLREGPDDLQNFPILFTTADGQTEGWLGVSEPDTIYRIDVYASAGRGPGGAGEAQDYLGSLQETTNGSGQVTFAIPFTAPAGLPILTATATDPQGNTSEVSALRPGNLDVPSQAIRLAPGQPVSFSAASGDGIVLQDPEAGPLDLPWDLTLSVAAGTLSLSTVAGLSGTGDGTGSLTYCGPLSAIDAALAGMSYTPPPGYQGDPSLDLDAQSEGAAPIQAQVPIVVTSGRFAVTTTADAGPGSLRQAILDSNLAVGGTNTIDFDIPGVGVETIAPASPLPTITTPLVLDGTMQPGYAGAPSIDIVGQPTGDADPLTAGSDVTLKGVAIGGSGFSSVNATTMLTVESVPISPGQGGMVSYQIVVTSDEDLVATTQAVGTSTSLSLLDALGQVVIQSDGLSAAEPIDAINIDIAPGTYWLRVGDDGGAGTFTLTAMTTPSATAFQAVPVGNSPDAVVAGDFAGNGKLDLAVANEDSNTVSILIGNGDGTFQSAVNYPAGNDPVAIVAGDFNGGGKVDLAVVNGGPYGTVSILLGNGDGTFQAPASYTVGDGPDAIAAGDFSGDGNLDLAVANSNSNNISILMNNGDGTFRPAVDYPVGYDPTEIVAGDFTGDGRLDLAVTVKLGIFTGELQVLLNNGDGTFRSAGAGPTTGGDAIAIVAGDFSGNGRLDLALAEQQGYVEVLMG
ncbi:MAG: beta strand repeat-containing protein, partial [Isosphaeraceae bacterium]